MAVHIRLKRQGRRKRPFYRIVAVDSRTRRNGSEIERLGWYNPIQQDLSVKINEERVQYWIGQGAIPTDTMKNLMTKTGLSYKMHLMKSDLSEDEINDKMKEWESRQLDKAKNAAKKKLDKIAAKKAASAPSEIASEESSVDEAPVESASEESSADEDSAEPSKNKN